jgi:Na+/melibiose symporter-like transporter
MEKGSGMFANRWWMDPILNGKPVKAFGIFHSNQKDMSDICQKLDFVGLNIYAPLTDYSKKSKTAKPEPGQPLTSIGWVVDGRVMYWTAKFVYERYKLPILITENGMADNDWVSLDSKVHDPQRTDYIQRYLSYVKKALAEGIPIIGYQYWSLFDNFEWALGYQPRFGLIHIDYKTQERTVKDSAFEYKKIIETNGSDLPIAKLKVAGIMENQTTQKIDGIMSSHFFDSRVTTRRISKKEIWFGHLIGPLGLIFVVNTLAAIVEKFLTQQAGAMYPNNADKLAALGIQYETIMTAAKIIGIFLSLFNGWLIQHIKSKQGRFRPLYFISGFVTIAIGATIFLFAGQNSLGDNYWFYFFAMVVLFNTVGSCYFYLFRDNIVSLSSRSAKDKEFLTFIRKVSWTLISGIVIGLVFNSVLIPYWLDHDISGYPKLMLILSLAAIPLFLLEYYYTKERVTEDVTYEEGLEKVNKVPLKAQLKALVTDKYFMILFVLTAVGTAVDTFKGGNVQYFYIKFLLGGETNYSMYTLYQVITGVPLGLGAIFIYPLSKKFGVKNISMVGYGLVFIGSILGWIMPDNLPIAMVGGFLRQTGMIPNSYIFPVLAIYANDDIEYRSKIRVEGLLGASLFTAIVAAISAPFAGGYESMLFKMGFVDADGVSATAEQKQFMTLSFYLFDLINSGLSLILLSFVDIEKKMPTISAELLRRKKEATLAKGEVWVEPEEAERLEAEQNAIEAENDRIADLKDRCAKKGLDFETENKKYLDRQEAKTQRKHKHNKA